MEAHDTIYGHKCPHRRAGYGRLDLVGGVTSVGKYQACLGTGEEKKKKMVSIIIKATHGTGSQVAVRRGLFWIDWTELRCEAAKWNRTGQT